MGIARGIVRGTVRGTVRGLVRSDGVSLYVTDIPTLDAFLSANSITYDEWPNIWDELGYTDAEDADDALYGINAYDGGDGILKSDILAAWAYLSVVVSPADVAAVDLWYKAGDASAVGDGNPVSAWADNSANGWDASQASASLRPLYSSDDGDGYPSIVFDGTNDLLAIPSALGIMRNISGWTFLAVAKPDVSKSTQIILGVGNGTSGYLRFWLNGRGDDGSWRMGGRASDADTVSRLSFGEMDGTRELVSCRIDFSTGYAELRENGRIEGKIFDYQDAAATSDTDSIRVHIGDSSHDTSHEYFKGGIYEIVAIPEYVDDATIAGLELDLATRNGVTLNASPQTFPYSIDDAWEYKDAAAITGLSDDDPVSEWAEETSIFAPASQASPTLQPLYKATAFNGGPCVRFDGVDDLLSYPANNAEVIAGTYHNNRNGLTFVFLCRVNVGVGSMGLHMQDSETEDALLINTEIDASQWSQGSRRLEADTEQSGLGGIVPDGVPVVVAFVYDYAGAKARVYRNSFEDLVIDPFQTAGRTEGNTEAFAVALGNDPSGTAPFDGDIKEKLIYGRALTPAEILTLTSEISVRNGIHFLSGSISLDGLSLTLVLPEVAATAPALTISASGGAVTADDSTATGAGTQTIVYPLSRSVLASETVTVSSVSFTDGLVTGGASDDVDAFRFTVRTTAPSETFTLPLTSSETYDFLVDWGDGNTDTITVWNSSDLIHSYATSGDYQITITGTFPRIYFNNAGDKLKLRSIDQWGNPSWSTDQTDAFYGCANLVNNIPADMTLDNVVDGYNMLRGCGITTLPEWITLPSLVNGNRMFAFNSITSISSSMALPSLTDGTQMFNFSNIPVARYSALLVAMEAANSNSGVTFHAGSSQYDGTATTARASLVSRSWSITDGGAI